MGDCLVRAKQITSERSWKSLENMAKYMLAELKAVSTWNDISDSGESSTAGARNWEGGDHSRWGDPSRRLITFTKRRGNNRMRPVISKTPRGGSLEWCFNNLCTLEMTAYEQREDGRQCSPFILITNCTRLKSMDFEVGYHTEKAAQSEVTISLPKSRLGLTNL